MIKNKALIVVDMQNDFVTGALANPAAQAIIPNIKNEIENGDYNQVIFTQDTHTVDYLETLEGKHLPVKHCIEGTRGWEIVPELQVYLKNDNAITLVKTTFGYNDWNLDWLQAIRSSNYYNHGYNDWNFQLLQAVQNSNYYNHGNNCNLDWLIKTYIDPKFTWPPTEAVLVGTCTDICVVSNALAIKTAFPECEVSVIEKCCAGVTPEKHAAAIEVMKSCQINIK